MIESKKRISQIEERISQEENLISELKQYAAQRDIIAPQLETVVDRYRSLPSAEEKNKLLKGIFVKIVYTKTVGGKSHGKDYELEIFPRIPKHPDLTE